MKPHDRAQCGLLRDPRGWGRLHSAPLAQCGLLRDPRGGERLSPAPSAQCGFTLIEVVVAIALLAVVVTLVYGAFARSLDVTRETADATERVRQVQLITERLVDELSAAYWFPESSGGSGRFEGTTGPALEPDTRMDKLVWTTFAHRRYVEGRPESDVSEVAYRVEVDAEAGAGRLVREERSNLLTDASWAVASDEVAEGVTEFKLRYRADAEWVDAWDAAQRRRLPQAVEVTVGLAGIGTAPPERLRTVVSLPLAVR
ncbi:MAG: prepilin-type N-terminal cleavage/methylation domain-containing protein [Nitrospirae bacterium]|nr:prepilin-type N-terminal cleavage/methylation domain-containing protein [Nitrospirota bacterium]